ncbi:MAG: ABC transporter ATP-binding protein [Akkermansiaceae bacterium]
MSESSTIKPESKPAYAVEIRDLVKTYKSSFKRQTFRAVDEVSLNIAPGEVYGLIGPNGSGKSTTMKALLGLVAPSSGICKVFGCDSRRVDARSEIGFLPENPYFYKHQTSAETLKFYGKLCGIKGKVLKDRVDELLELVSLDHARNRRLGGYSKGMLQRVGLAQALIQNPRLLVLDEPTAGVDPIGSREIRDLIFKLKKEGVTIFLCSHLLEQVQEVCDRVGIIFEGKMVNEGTLEELTAIENQHELILENADDGLLESIDELIRQHSNSGAKLISSGTPRSSLEKLFIDTAKSRSRKENK